MLFFKAEAEIVNAKNYKVIVRKENDENTELVENTVNFRQSDQWKSFKDFSQQYTEEFYQKTGKQTYVFTSGIKSETSIILGAISTGVEGVPELIKKYMKAIDADFRNTTVTEVTLESVRSLLQTSDRNGLIEDDDDVLEMFNLDSFGRYRNLDFEEILITKVPSKKALIGMSNSLLCGETLIPEIERIYEVPVNAVRTAHPVHYIIQTDDTDVREKMIHVLLTALYANKRIRSRRYCKLTDVSSYRGLPWDEYDAFYQSCRDGAVIANYTSKDEAEGEYAKPNLAIIEGICKTAKKHKNDVLTIFCLPRTCEKVKNTFMERLGTVTLVSLNEETVFGERAKKYLRQLAKNQCVATDKALYKAVPDMDKGYLAADLNRAFDEWFGKKLKTQVFPQYASFESACSKAIRKKAVGSAYGDLEEMIGLTEAKKVIAQALDFYKAQKLFKEKGVSKDRPSMHMVFTGNPGTAKTSVARLFAQIMKDNGLLSVGDLHEVGRADLVGQYVGWTAPIVKRKFKDAKGSVLFIDEAYSLVDDKDGLYGDEAINTIVQEMENHREDMVVIFAGYPDKMEGFLRKNPGLRSRIAFHVPFVDYDADELYRITELIAKQKDITLDESVREKLIPIYESAMKNDDFGNGRFARNLLEKAVLKQASRLVAMDADDVTKTDVTTLLADDFEMPESQGKEVRRIGFVA